MNARTKQFVLQTPDLIKVRQLLTRIKMSIFVTIISEPCPAQFASV